MLVNSISSANVQNTSSAKYMSNLIVPEKKEVKTEGYAPVTASLWGSSASFRAAFGINSSNGIDPNFGAARPTNNPKDMAPIEADTQAGFRLSTLDMPMICPDCGKPIMTKPIFAGIKSELDNVPEDEYLSVVESHSEFLFPQEQKIIAHIKEIKKANPEMSIRDIVATEREVRFDKLEEQQYKVMDKMEEIAEVLPYEDRSKVTGLITMSTDIIFHRSNNYAFQRSEFLKRAEALEMKDKEAKAKILEIAQELPSSIDNEDAWYVKYGGLDNKKQPYSSRAIAEKLLAPAYTNTDHIHPWNRGGYDAVSNFWLMHARCNVIKTDKPFMEWVNEDKENRVGYIKQYLTDAQAAIDASDDSKMHPKYDLYSAKLAKTIYYESNGEIDFTKDFPLPEGYDVPRPESNEKKAVA